MLETLQENAADSAYSEAMAQWRSEYAYDIAYTALNIEKPQPTADAATDESGSGADSTASANDSAASAASTAEESAQ